jgi:hypothetical protein
VLEHHHLGDKSGHIASLSLAIGKGITLPCPEPWQNKTIYRIQKSLVKQR